MGGFEKSGLPAAPGTVRTEDLDVEEGLFEDLVDVDSIESDSYTIFFLHNIIQINYLICHNIK